MPTFDSDPHSASVSDSSSSSTYFAPAARSGPDELREQLTYIGNDPVLDALMRAMAGLVAIVNEKREVLALNTRFLEFLGVKDPAKLLGLRIGETVGCVHSHQPPNGCGTTEYCSTCGAAIAQVTSLATAHPVERTCAIDVEHPVNGVDQLYFRVQACPIERGSRRLLLLFLQDISEQQQRAALDRTFFHDVNNTICAVLTASEFLAQDKTRPDAKIAATLAESARRLAREIELQRCLAEMALHTFEPMLTPVPVSAVMDEVARMCETRREASGRRIEVAALPPPAPVVNTDPTLLMRVIQNMTLNALEATPRGGIVKLWAEVSPHAVEYCVWNDAVIPSDVALRVFQRNFSTKNTPGRGLGTFSMKLIGERMLGGLVTFTSQPGQGTCFRFRLPV